MFWLLRDLRFKFFESTLAVCHISRIIVLSCGNTAEYSSPWLLCHFLPQTGKDPCSCRDSPEEAPSLAISPFPDNLNVIICNQCPTPRQSLERFFPTYQGHPRSFSFCYVVWWAGTRSPPGPVRPVLEFSPTAVRNPGNPPDAWLLTWKPWDPVMHILSHCCNHAFIIFISHGKIHHKQTKICKMDWPILTLL